MGLSLWLKTHRYSRKGYNMEEKKKNNYKKIALLVICIVLIMSGIGIISQQKSSQNKDLPSLTPVRTGQVDSKEKLDERKQTLKVLTDVMNGERNPALATTSGEIAANSFIFEPLARRDANGVMQNILAKSIKISEDGKLITVKLPRKLFFSDGTKVTASDVAASISLVCYMGENTCQQIKGSETFIKGETNKLKGVTIVDKRTLTIEFDTSKISNQMVLEVPIQKGDFVNWDSGGNPYKHLSQSLGDGIGTGAYILETADTDKILLKSNQNYRTGAPQIKQVEIKQYVFTDLKAALLKGDVDLIRFSNENPAFDMLFEEKGLSLYECPQEQLLCLAFNYDIEMMRNQDLRKGIAYALDREDYLSKEGKLYYSPETNFLLEQNIYKPEGVINKDLGEARKLVKKAKKEMDLDQIVLRLPLLKGDNKVYEKMAKTLKKQLAAIDITLEITKMSQEEYMDALYLRNGFDICFTGEDINAEYSSLSKLVERRNGLPIAPENISEFNKELVELKEKGGFPIEGPTVISAFQTKVFQQAVLLPIARRKQYIAVSADLAGYQITPYNTLAYDFGKAKIQ